jgi:hypothetical protein
MMGRGDRGQGWLGRAARCRFVFKELAEVAGGGIVSFRNVMSHTASLWFDLRPAALSISCRPF